LTELRKICKYQMSSKSVQLEPNWSVWTEGRTGGQMRRSQKSFFAI